MLPRPSEYNQWYSASVKKKIAYNLSFPSPTLSAHKHINEEKIKYQK